MTTAKVWQLKKRIEGVPKFDDFELVEETLSTELKDNEILVEAVYLTVDPYMRFYTNAGQKLPGEQVSRVIKSKAKDYPEGALVKVYSGWRSHSIVDITQLSPMGTKVDVVEDIPGVSPSLWLGAAGMPGLTAYLSFFDRCDPKPDEVIVVTAAAGAVGAVVGQLAKLKGLKVIGIAGSEEKCNYIKDLGFDFVINYKKDDISEAIDKAAPSGVDIYYDNVGGDISDIVYGKLRERGRVLICGLISTYNKPPEETRTATNWNFTILMKELSILGFKVSNAANVPRVPEARRELISLIQKGQLQTKEHVTEGFERMPQAFIDLFSGANFGKAIVKV